MFSLCCLILYPSRRSLALLLLHLIIIIIIIILSKLCPDPPVPSAGSSSVTCSPGCARAALSAGPRAW